jgi:hypothetical protein
MLVFDEDSDWSSICPPLFFLVVDRVVVVAAVARFVLSCSTDGRGRLVGWQMSLDYPLWDQNV